MTRASPGSWKTPASVRSGHQRTVSDTTRKLRHGGGYAAVLLQLTGVALALGWMPDAAAQLSASKADTGKHMGVATCSSTLCHGSVRALEARSVLQNEYVTWSGFDPHSRAYRILF